MCVTLFRVLVAASILRPISKQHDACTYTSVSKRCVVEIVRFHRKIPPPMFTIYIYIYITLLTIYFD